MKLLEGILMDISRAIYEDYLSASRSIAGVKASDIELFMSEDSKNKIAKMWGDTEKKLHNFSHSTGSEKEPEVEEEYNPELDAQMESYYRAIDFTTAHEIIARQFLMLAKQKKEIERMQDTISRKSNQVARLKEKLANT